jgi:hypothetical protein
MTRPVRHPVPPALPIADHSASGLGTASDAAAADRGVASLPASAPAVARVPPASAITAAARWAPADITTDGAS